MPRLSRAPPEKAKAPTLTPASFADLPGSQEDDLALTWGAFRASCRTLRFREHWRAACRRACPEDARRRRDPGVVEADFVRIGSRTPMAALRRSSPATTSPAGGRARGAPYVHPPVRTADDLLVIDLAAVAPETSTSASADGSMAAGSCRTTRAPRSKAVSLRRGQGARLCRRCDRGVLPSDAGLGQVGFESGAELRLGYADQNGHAYHSMRRYLVEKGELSLGEASMPGRSAWARANTAPARRAAQPGVRASSSSRTPPAATDPGDGPIGALSPCDRSAGSRSTRASFRLRGAGVAGDDCIQEPAAPFERMTLAQDTSSAIRGADARQFLLWAPVLPPAPSPDDQRQSRMDVAAEGGCRCRPA